MKQFYLPQEFDMETALALMAGDTTDTENAYKDTEEDDDDLESDADTVTTVDDLDPSEPGDDSDEANLVDR